MRRQSGGFTLVELLVVIAILGALAGVLVPSILSSRKKSTRTQCLGNLRQLGILANLYADEQGGWYPKAGGKAPVFESYQKLVDVDPNLDPKILVSPAHRDEPAEKDGHGRVVLAESNVSYTYIFEETQNIAPADTPLASNDSQRGPGSDEGHENGVNLVTISGTVTWVPSDDLEGRTFPAGLIDNLGNTE